MRLRDEGDKDLDLPSNASKVVTNNKQIGFAIPPATAAGTRPDLCRRGGLFLLERARKNFRVIVVDESVKYGSSTMMGDLFLSC